MFNTKSSGVCVILLALVANGICSRVCRINENQCQIGCKEFKKDKYGCTTCRCLTKDTVDTIEGDMVLTPELKSLIMPNNKTNKAVTTTSAVTRWSSIINPNSNDKMYEIPYAISWALKREKSTMAAINAAIKDFYLNTCIYFRPRNTNTNEHYVRIIKGGGCYSYVGVQSKAKKQKLSLGSGCGYKGIVIHELLHTLGILHEQSRPDRDNNVIIHWENIQDNREHNFNKYSTSMINSLGSPYDFGSVMHYGGFAFSKNNKATITRKDTNDPVVAQRDGFSKEDIFQVNAMYNCGDTVGTKQHQCSSSRGRICQFYKNNQDICCTQLAKNACRKCGECY